jgi:hypothetical protein
LISLVGTASTAGPEPDRRTTGHLSVSRLSSASPLARQAAWDAYRSEVVPNDAAYPRVIYARSLRVGRDLYLQYWQFYPFNDWHNWHEADWEVVMIRFVPLADDHWKAAAAIYSSHLGGLWRPWQDVEHVATQVRPAGLTPDQDAAHPVVYVARGSHAQYFAAVPDGYPASLTQSFGPARFSFSTDWSDVVVSSSNAQDRVTYGLRAFPRRGEHMTVESRAWPRWWWLRYLGRWGAHEGIFGPTAQLDKWAAPDVWAASSCVGDPGSWKLLGGSDR